MAKKIYIKNGVNLDSATSLSGYKIVGYNSDDELSNLSEKNDLGDIREIGGGGSSSVAPGNGVTASGTINYISKFTDTNILGNSLIFDNGTNVGIGLTAPSTKLHVYGTQSGAFRLQDTTEGLNKVLTSDANGVATWATASVASGNGVTASGTTNSVSMFTGTNTLGNSIISQPNDYTLNMYANNNTSSFNMYNANVLKTTLDFSNPNSVFSLTSVGGIDFNSGYGGTINLLTSYADIVAHGYRGKVVLKITDPSSVEHVATLANNGNFGIGTASPNSKLHVYDGNIELSLGRGLLYSGYTTFTTDSFNGSSLLIGRGATGTSQAGEGYIALGLNSHSTEMGIAIGISSNVNNGTYDGIAIGRSSTVNGGLVRGVAIGRNATALHTNSWALGYNAVTTQDNEFNFGVSGTLHKYIFNGQVGIGTSSPTTYLHINATQSGAFRLVDTTEGLNKVLTSDTNGVGTWASIGSIGIGTTNKSVDTRGFTASVTETITHNLNSNSVIVQNYDSTGLQVIAGSVLITGTGSVDITFSQTLSNVKTIIIG